MVPRRRFEDETVWILRLSRLRNQDQDYSSSAETPSFVVPPTTGLGAEIFEGRAEDLSSSENPGYVAIARGSPWLL